MSMEMKPTFDLPSFVRTLISASPGPLSIPWTTTQIDNEVTQVQRNMSRDAHTRFQQVRYMNSLNRLQQCLKTCELPADLTPRERLAFKTLSQALSTNQHAAELTTLLDQVTLPEGLFATSGLNLQRMAS